VVDGNVARVLARIFGLQQEINSPAGARILWNWAAALTDPKNPRAFNSGLMELGQCVCTARRPACGECPVHRHCRSAGPNADSLPRKRPARATVAVDEYVIWARRNGRVLLTRETGRRRHGLWRLPDRSTAEVRDLPVIHRVRYSITHHRVTLHVHASQKITARPGEVWQPLSALADLPMPGPFRKAVANLLQASSATA
jgi:A/G-specific adenine glycosylase